MRKLFRGREGSGGGSGGGSGSGSGSVVKMDRIG